MLRKQKLSPHDYRSLDAVPRTSYIGYVDKLLLSVFQMTDVTDGVRLNERMIWLHLRSPEITLTHCFSASLLFRVQWRRFSPAPCAVRCMHCFPVSH